MSTILEFEWSHLIDADDVGAEKLRLSISPDDEAKNNLLRRLSVLSLESLTADLVLQREQGGMVVHINGHIKASLEQACVVTLEPVKASIDDTFEAWFADPAQAIPLAKAKHERMAKTGGAEVPVLDESDDPEPIINGKIDIGELVVQHLSLMLDPYPHAEGVRYEYGDDEPQKVPEAFKSNPFAALKDWKSKLEDK